MMVMGCHNPDPGVSLLSASGTSYRVVSRVFDMPRSTVTALSSRVAKEVLAIYHQEIHILKTWSQGCS